MALYATAIEREDNNTGREGKADSAWQPRRRMQLKARSLSAN